jgi:hypothetical protein
MPIGSWFDGFKQFAHRSPPGRIRDLSEGRAFYSSNFFYCTNSKSPGFHVLSNQGSSGA